MNNSIKKIRERRKLTQKQLSEITGIDQANLSQHESGKKMMREDTIRRLCDALECTPTQLMKEST
jgi:DNA-binding Xre family transcriptional regulator